MTNPLEHIRDVIADTLNAVEKMREVRRILDASQGYVCVPVEVAYVCVPVEPTEAMINAGSQAGEWGSERDVWSAMLAASKETNRG